MTRIGFIGAGLMGHGIAANLLAAGHALHVLGHRNRKPVEDLVARGAREAVSLEDLARSSEVVFLCLPSSREVEAVVEAITPALAEGGLVIDVTTADPESTRRVGAGLRGMGVGMVDAPVTRAPQDAEAGRLISLVGAEEADFARARPLIACYSEKVIHMGGPATGHTAKLLNNLVTTTQTAILTQAYQAARAAGVDWSALHDAMSQGAARSGSLEKMIVPALQGDFRGHAFALQNAFKDIDYARSLLQGLGRQSPLADGVRAHFAAAVEAGLGERWCSELLDPDLGAAEGRKA